MVSLYQYFEQESWDNFVLYVKAKSFQKNISIYENLMDLDIFPNDINIVLTSLYDYMFYSKKEIFEKWLLTKIKMLDDQTPLEATKSLNGTNSLREYLMRRPL